MSIFGYDWHYDRNHDGEIDFFEDYMRMDEFDRLNKTGLYAEEDEEDEDDDDILDRLDELDEDELDDLELDDLDLDDIDDLDDLF